MIIQAQVRIPRISGLPEDITTNTFHFLHSGTPVAADFDALAARLEAFYENTATGETIPVRQFFNSLLLTEDVQVRFYDAENPDVGGPLAVRDFTVDWTGTGSFPEEAAICLSYKAAPVVDVPPARLRGRIFIGPVASDSSEIVSGTVRVKETWRTALTASAKEFLMDSAGDPWVVFSRGKGTAAMGSTTPTATADWTPFTAEINQTWCDDAFDTIRSRGPKATARTVSTAA